MKRAPAILWVICCIGAINGYGACDITERYNRDGWRIPGLDGAQVKTPDQSRQEGSESVSVEVLVPSLPAARVLLPICDPRNEHRVEIRDQAVDVKEIWRLRSNNRVFAYLVRWVPVIEENGERIPMAKMAFEIYYDMEGQGKFTVARGASTEFKVEIPDWVRVATPR
jgi:hypothetical protein